MKFHARILLSTSALFGLSACAPALFQAQDSMPAFYRPGPDGETASYDAEPTVQTTPIAPANLEFASSRPPLAPQEVAGDGRNTWLGDAKPTAGPAPRNAISGGLLDVGVVPAAPEGTPTIGAPTHGIEPTESGRLYILELYQEILEERDALEIEVSGLLEALETAQAEVANLRGAVQSDSGTLAALNNELALLRAENADLAARLTTAQIRRLEAEKILLENRIDSYRTKSTQETPPASGVALGSQRP